MVFFDAGETLLRAEPSFPELAAKVIRSRGHQAGSDDVIRTSRELGSHFRRAADEGRTFSASADESKAFWTAFYTDMLGHLGIDDPEAPEVLFQTFSNPDNYGLFDDVLPALDQLQAAGLRLGIISNFEGWLEGLLRRLGILNRFDVVAISGPLAVEKPDPRIFKWAVEQAGVSADRCVHVGDQPYFDAEAATACGLHGVLLDRYGRWPDVREFPVIPTLRELPTVAARLGA
ncbi:MAG TPA: HAD-IA family hydrolase [Actinomycetota bacterium]|nr:HAD-IA family hydrolase [Actinomycetota bacterium]